MKLYKPCFHSSITKVISLQGFRPRRRREFITLLGGAAAWPLAARAQQPAKLRTIGFLGPSTMSVAGERIAAFAQRLRELGWIEAKRSQSSIGGPRDTQRGCLT
jgi:hypothetical protein